MRRSKLFIASCAREIHTRDTHIHMHIYIDNTQCTPEVLCCERECHGIVYEAPLFIIIWFLHVVIKAFFPPRFANVINF